MQTFKTFDIVGPRMIGPSSSHTAGAARLAYVAWRIAGEDVQQAELTLYGSFAQTGRGHGTDKALLAGVLGLHPDDERLRYSRLLAQEAGVEYTIRFVGDPPTHYDYANMARICKKHDIKYVLFNGGNGSMDACGKLYKACVAEGVDVRVVGIPKTIDNDIAVTDHAPGFGSAARYIAAITSEVSQDVRSLPIHVSVIEAMGRNAGWIAAASALARSGNGDGPDMIYLPERPFIEEEFLERVLELHRKKGGVVIVTSEGLCNPDGSSIVPPIFQVGRSVYYGDVSAHLANLVIQKLGIKARSEKPGICNRSSIAFQSSVDREEAVIAGAEACRAALNGENGVMVGFRRVPGPVYKSETFLIPVEQVMLHERKMPDEFISADGRDVTPAFVDWCRPLIGEELRRFVTFKPQL